MCEDENSVSKFCDSSLIILQHLKYQNYVDIKTTLTQAEKLSDINALTGDNLMVHFNDFLSNDEKFRNAEISIEDKQLDILRHMLDLLKDENKDKFTFYIVAFSVLDQSVHDEVEVGKKSSIQFESQDVNDDLKRIDAVNSEYSHYIKLVLKYYSNREKPEKVERANIIANLLLSLKKGFMSKFEQSFKKIINEEKNKFGFYYEVSLKPLARFCFYIARAKSSYGIFELILRLFPHVDENSCEITSFYELRYLKMNDDAALHCKLKSFYSSIIDYQVCRILQKIGLPEGLLSKLIEYMVCCMHHDC